MKNIELKDKPFIDELQDSTDHFFSEVTCLSHEFVTFLEKGGARKTYQTNDFLALAPRNLSNNFRVAVVFGVSYDLQGQAPGQLMTL